MGVCAGGVRLAWMAGSIGDKGTRMLIRSWLNTQGMGGCVGGEGGLGEKNARLLKLENT